MRQFLALIIVVVVTSYSTVEGVGIEITKFSSDRLTSLTGPRIPTRLPFFQQHPIGGLPVIFSWLLIRGEQVSTLVTEKKLPTPEFDTGGGSIRCTNLPKPCQKFTISSKGRPPKPRFIYLVDLSEIKEMENRSHVTVKVHLVHYKYKKKEVIYPVHDPIEEEYKDFWEKDRVPCRKTELREKWLLLPEQATGVYRLKLTIETEQGNYFVYTPPFELVQEESVT